MVYKSITRVFVITSANLPACRFLGDRYAYLQAALKSASVHSTYMGAHLAVIRALERHIASNYPKEVKDLNCVKLVDQTAEQQDKPDSNTHIINLLERFRVVWQITEYQLNKEDHQLNAFYP